MKKVDLVLRHYNKLRPIGCSIVSGDTSKLFTVKVNKSENGGAEIIKGDPVLIGLLNDDESFIINGGSIIGINQKKDQYIICPNNTFKTSREIEKRQYERYPISLHGDIKRSKSNKRETVCIKDLSYAGMCIFSEGQFEINDPVEVNIYLSNSVSKYDGIVVRKSVNFGRNEYGISIIHRDKNAMYSTEAHMTSLIQSEKELIYRHLLNTKYHL